MYANMQCIQYTLNESNLVLKALTCRPCAYYGLSMFWQSHFSQNCLFIDFCVTHVCLNSPMLYLQLGFCLLTRDLLLKGCVSRMVILGHEVTLRKYSPSLWPPGHWEHIFKRARLKNLPPPFCFPASALRIFVL